MTPELTYSKVRGKVLILDEFDYMVDEQCVVFEEVFGKMQLKGFVNTMHAKKAYLFSATVEVFHRQFATILLGLNVSNIRQYPSMFKLADSDGRGSQALIDKKLAKGVKDTIAILRRVIDQYVTE